MSLGVKWEEFVDCKYLKKGRGCAKCQGTGHKDRETFCEVLELTPKMKEMVTKKKSQLEIKQVAIECNGMATLRQNALKNLRSGKTTVEQVYMRQLGMICD